MKWKAFENNVAKTLSDWYFGDEKVLRRSPCSGGWLRRGGDNDIIVAKDQQDKEALWPFAVECKCRGTGKETWHLETLFTAEKHPVKEWWKQLSESDPVKKGGQWRMLVFSKTSGVASALVAIGAEVPVEAHNINSLLWVTPVETVAIFRLVDFVKCVNLNILMEAWSRE